MNAPDNALMAAICRYRGEWNLYLARCLEAEARGESDELVPHYYKASGLILEDWGSPATSLDEARLALEMAIADYEVGETPRIPAMMKAALGWLTAEQKRRTFA
jgi:hypothetical protein